MVSVARATPMAPPPPPSYSVHAQAPIGWAIPDLPHEHSAAGKQSIRWTIFIEPKWKETYTHFLVHWFDSGFYPPCKCACESVCMPIMSKAKEDCQLSLLTRWSFDGIDTSLSSSSVFLVVVIITRDDEIDRFSSASTSTVSDESCASLTRLRCSTWWWTKYSTRWNYNSTRTTIRSVVQRKSAWKCRSVSRQFRARHLVQWTRMSCSSLIRFHHSLPREIVFLFGSSSLCVQIEQWEKNGTSTSADIVRLGYFWLFIVFLDMLLLTVHLFLFQ